MWHLDADLQIQLLPVGTDPGATPVESETALSLKQPGDPHALRYVHILSLSVSADTGL